MTLTVALQAELAACFHLHAWTLSRFGLCGFLCGDVKHECCGSPDRMQVRNLVYSLNTSDDNADYAMPIHKS
jgi:hypothetical protein